MGGANGLSIIGWNWLYGDPVTGWRIVAIADFNADGKPDIVWQNDTTRQATVNYFGGAQGNTLTGWNWLYAGATPGWRIAGANDFNRDGTPDVVWQNEATGHATVNYFGGDGGTVLQGWNWLSTGDAAGWRLIVPR